MSAGNTQLKKLHAESIVNATAVLARIGSRWITPTPLPNSEGDEGGTNSGGASASMRAASAPIATRITGNTKGNDRVAHPSGGRRVRYTSPANPAAYTTRYVIDTVELLTVVMGGSAA
jgi:hypothetical protein